MKNEMVQLVIKAPNQLTKDQTVECDRMWTVGQLKEHLFKEYPTHPKPESQKLIYSGKLLSDDMLITDVLKTYGGHEYNTVHLVSSIRESTRINRIVPPPMQSPGPSHIEPQSANPTVSSSHAANSQNVDANNVIRRDVNGCNFRPFLPGNGVQYVYSQQDLAQQMVLFQQAYIQYMTNYINMANNGRYHLDNQYNEYPHEEPTHAEVPQNPVEAEVEDEAGAQRDWLEWIYIATRLVLLFSVVYFYSSPLRFIVVMSMALLLFNMDVERWRRRQDEVPDNGQGQQGHNGDGPVHWQQAGRPQAEGHTPHPLHIVTTFVTSFFLSLIPEQRAM